MQSLFYRSISNAARLPNSRIQIQIHRPLNICIRHKVKLKQVNITLETRKRVPDMLLKSAKSFLKNSLVTADQMSQGRSRKYNMVRNAGKVSLQICKNPKAVPS